jgi:hypothetical protein
MSTHRRVTAPPEKAAVAVTNSLRSDVPSQTVGFFSETPPGNRQERRYPLTQRIFFDTAIPSLSLTLSGFPL